MGIESVALTTGNTLEVCFGMSALIRINKMKHSKEGLEAMSDLQLSMVILQINNNGYLFPTRDTDSHAGLVLSDQSSEVYFDINNPSDIMPLVFEEKISIDYYHENTQEGNDPTAFTWRYYGFVSCQQEKELRAVAIVYILIKQGG